MAIEILETTVPASADSGVRTFMVQHIGVDGRPVTALDISVCKLEDRALDGEESQLLEIRDEVPVNEELARAWINLGAALLNTVGSRLSNPND
jgi:hypothetical protein